MVLDCSSLLAERSEYRRASLGQSSADSPPPAREGGPAGGAAGGPKNTHFRFISHHNRGSKLNWPGVSYLSHTYAAEFRQVDL